MTIEGVYETGQQTLNPPSEEAHAFPGGDVPDVADGAGAKPERCDHRGGPLLIPPQQIALVTQFLRRAGFRRVLHDKLRLGEPCLEHPEHNITLGHPPVTYSIQPASAERCNLCIHEQRRVAPAGVLLPGGGAVLLPGGGAVFPQPAAPRGLVHEIAAAVVAGDIEIDHLERYPELDTICTVASVAGMSAANMEKRAGHGA